MDKDKIDKKDHILDVAEKIFSDLGFDGASTRMISGEAGVNMAMLNYYFGSKEGLFLAVFERKISSFQTLLQNIGNDESMSSWDKLAKCIDNYVERIIVNNCFQKLINRELSMSKRSELSDKITQILMVNVLEIKKILDDGIKNGTFFKDTDTPLAIATIFGTKNYIINTPNISSLMLGHDVRDEKYLEEQLKPRVKTYMKRLIKAYLVNDNDNTK
ncbi:TetR family transcriptional regulator [Mucilaginibacter frigoritolerans]|jgi:AcrR family transcriptional regulator|uniref:TetR family transcriptional regulator n=1 Tax=Mucilaginibacter frigoritolerans TaxID=652788 RepID=A0A562UDD6_9SPHI|nr:TetR/AcrR family transcriptional regulator [Mucilaginibacter frigoritolerans]TWJ03285.1 TetR family transcriptional regulator [Mucilaginibacter frigoritolerans]